MPMADEVLQEFEREAVPTRSSRDLRLLDIPVPSMYEPSADEDPYA